VDFSAGKLSVWTRFDFVKSGLEVAHCGARLVAADVRSFLPPKFRSGRNFEGPKKLRTSAVWTCFCFTKAGLEARYACEWWTRDVRSLGHPWAREWPEPRGPRPKLRASRVFGPTFALQKQVWKSRFCRIATGWDWAQFWGLGRFAGPKTWQANLPTGANLPLANLGSGPRFAKGRFAPVGKFMSDWGRFV